MDFVCNSMDVYLWQTLTTTQSVLLQLTHYMPVLPLTGFYMRATLAFNGLNKNKYHKKYQGLLGLPRGLLLSLHFRGSRSHKL